MRNITERQLQILEHLAEFKYLNSAQLMRLLGVKTLPHVNTLLNRLSDGNKPLTRFKDFGFYPGYGRLPRIHYLTPSGADFLADNLGYERDRIKLTKERTPMFQRDYFHRVSTIDFNIGLRQFCIENNFEKVFFNYYFDQVGSQRHGTGKAKNAIPVGDFQIIPDGVGKITDGENETLFLFEQHNGKDSKRAIKQIYSHIKAIEEGAASLKYDYLKGVRVFYVFESEGCASSVINELNKDANLKPYEKFFLFSTNDLMKKNFNDWHTFSGEKKEFP